MTDFKIRYDEEFDDLFLYKKNSKSEGSIELGDIIIDLDNKYELVGLQFINASKTLKNVVNKELKSLLKVLKQAKI